jgi:hypothetical protein
MDVAVGTLVLQRETIVLLRYDAIYHSQSKPLADVQNLSLPSPIYLHHQRQAPQNRKMPKVYIRLKPRNPPSPTYSCSKRIQIK